MVDLAEDRRNVIRDCPDPVVSTSGETGMLCGIRKQKRLAVSCFSVAKGPEAVTRRCAEGAASQA